jgi:hypothetical protein
MLPPSGSRILYAWERGLEQSAVERGVTLLALACPSASSDELASVSVGERNRRLLALREAVFGPRMTGLAACPQCGNQLELEISASDLRVPPDDDAPLQLAGDDYDIRLRLPDSRDLLLTAGQPQSAAALLLERCVVSARHHGATVSPADLPEAMRDSIADRLSTADPLVNIRLATICADCGHRWSPPFDVVSFLWTEVDACAVRLLRDVHVLATAYGWSEQEIVNLSPQRRRFYLRMLTE